MHGPLSVDGSVVTVESDKRTKSSSDEVVKEAKAPPAR